MKKLLIPLPIVAALFLGACSDSSDKKRWWNKRCDLSQTWWESDIWRCGLHIKISEIVW